MRTELYLRGLFISIHVKEVLCYDNFLNKTKKFRRIYRKKGKKLALNSFTEDLVFDRAH